MGKPGFVSAGISRSTCFISGEENAKSGAAKGIAQNFVRFLGRDPQTSCVPCSLIA